MSKWPDKYIIGLTGNIATGKSVARKMLERLGAFGLDADALAHRAISRDAPGYAPIVKYFGRWILAPDQQIDRGRLGKIVFNDPAEMARLEAIIHPLVNQAVDIIVRRATQPLIIIEAIKLLESDLVQMIDSVWVVTASRETQIARLTGQRKMTIAEAEMRIDAQTRQEEKISQADVIINNDGSYEETWEQVYAGWKKIALPTSVLKEPVVNIPKGKIAIRRGTPRDHERIIQMVTRLEPNGQKRSKADILRSLNDNAFMLVEVEQQIVGIIGWQIENLICRTTDIFIDPAIPLPESMPAMIDAVEKSARDHQCEASLLFLPPNLARHTDIWKSLHYENRTPQSLDVQAWQEAALESMPFGTLMYFKQLRQDRVLRPI